MTIADYIQRAYVQARLPRNPMEYTALIDRLQIEGRPNLSETEKQLARELADADVIVYEDRPIYANEYDEAPIRRERRYYIPQMRVLKYPSDSPSCPGCADNAAEVLRLRARVAELEELLYEKQGAALAEVG